jgi:hypothetical protein
LVRRALEVGLTPLEATVHAPGATLMEASS